MLLRFSPKIEHLKMVALSPVEGVVFEKTLIQLLPGVNEVTEEEWQGIKPNIEKELANGEIIILAQKVAAGRNQPGGRKAKDLIQMPVNIAVKYISECMNPETLLKWFREETRDQIRIYITRKLEKLGVEIPEDEIPEAPNASPMSFEEYEEQEEQEEEFEEEEEEVIDLNTKKYTELKSIAKNLGISNWDTLKKTELIEAISNMAQ